MDLKTTIRNTALEADHVATMSPKLKVIPAERCEKIAKSYAKSEITKIKRALDKHVSPEIKAQVLKGLNPNDND